MDAISVTVRRGDIVEAVHHVHVARPTATTRGDDDLVCFLRSSMKPLQAIPFVEGYDDLDADELAIACASHQAEPAQLAAVRKLLARAGRRSDDLENGAQDGRPDGKLGHNCSGKHAGMLAACRAHDWPLHPYRDSGPSAAAADRRARRPGGRRRRRLRRADVRDDARRGWRALFTTIPTRIVAAMRAQPELVGGSAPTTPT